MTIGWQDTLGRIIAGIGRADFVGLTATALCDHLEFELSAVVLHPQHSAPRVLFDDFDTVGCRHGLDNYVRVTHAINPMLTSGPVPEVCRASDYEIRPPAFGEPYHSHLLRAPDEELGYRTVGWPEKMEEINLYVATSAGLTELGLYRSSGRAKLPAHRLRQLRRLTGPIAAAFDRDRELSPARDPDPFSSRLSQRELEVVALLLTGCNTEAIGLRLNLTHHTVKGYRKQIYRKLAISSLSELFALAHPDA